MLTENDGSKATENNENKILKYEDLSDIIDIELNKRKGKWQCSKVDWQDAAQIARLRIFQKFSLWDQKRPFVNYINRIITNVLINIVRDNLTRFRSPCKNCASNEGNGLCRINKNHLQGPPCPLYVQWQVSKQESNYNINLPVAIEQHIDEVNSISADSFDVEDHQKKLTVELKKVLNDREMELYILMFVRNLTPEQVADQMGFKSSENKPKGYRQVHNLKTSIIAKAKEIVAKGEIFD